MNKLFAFDNKEMIDINMQFSIVHYDLETNVLIN